MTPCLAEYLQPVTQPSGYVEKWLPKKYFTAITTIHDRSTDNITLYIITTPSESMWYFIIDTCDSSDKRSPTVTANEKVVMNGHISDSSSLLIN